MLKDPLYLMRKIGRKIKILIQGIITLSYPITLHLVMGVLLNVCVAGLMIKERIFLFGQRLYLRTSPIPRGEAGNKQPVLQTFLY